MNTALGLVGSWQTAPDRGATEKDVFDRVQLQPGEQTIMNGAIALHGELFFPSCAKKQSDDELEIHGLDSSGRTRALIARRDSGAVFADALSLAW